MLDSFVMFIAIILFITTVKADLHKPDFSWDTLPVFIHTQNGTGPWSDAAAKAIAKYPLATYEKTMAWDPSNPDTNWPEYHNTAACRQINEASGNRTVSLYYLNSVIDYGMYLPHLQMQAHPEYRLQTVNGTFISVLGDAWGFNHSIDTVREFWKKDCLDAIDAGCGGCYLDKSNTQTQPGSPQISQAQSDQWVQAHHQALNEVIAELSEKPNRGTGGAFAVLNNQGDTQAVPGWRMMMLEDFGASEHCITTLQTMVSRGLGVQAHAGDLKDGENSSTTGDGDACVNGGTNALAVFLLGAGEYSYYHCAPKADWISDPKWPAVPDPWLDWEPVTYIYIYSLSLSLTLSLAYIYIGLFMHARSLSLSLYIYIYIYLLH